MFCARNVNPARFRFILASTLLACGLPVWWPAVAYAAPVGLVAVDNSDDLAQELGLSVCRVSLVVDSPEDELISISSGAVEVDAHSGIPAFYQHPFGSDTAPSQGLIDVFPELALDSFVTIGVSVNDGTDSTMLGPTWDSGLFNEGGGASGDWFNGSPFNGQGLPNADLQVLLAQFTVPPGDTVTGTITVFTAPDLVEFTADFICPVAGPGCAVDADCEDGDPCTTNVCDPIEGCITSIGESEPPTIACPADVEIGCDDSTDPSNTGLATATDNCDPNPVIGYQDTIEGECPPEAVLTRTWTAIDSSGNTSTCDQLIFEISGLPCGGHIFYCEVAAQLESPPAKVHTRPVSAGEDVQVQEGGPAAGASAETDPIYLFSGEFHQSNVDLRIPGRGPDFVWARKYRSKVGPDTEMGNGWDYSYNIYLESLGSDMLVHDGNSRRDIYTLQPGGTWAHPQFFRELRQNPDTTFSLVFADRGEWRFHPLNGDPWEGKISAIVDRNGNSLTFQYDPAGRLMSIRDTLFGPVNPRQIDVAYNADGFIESVTDFAGRTVSYGYYGPGDPGGSPGDLKSVTTPVVVGTPNGNDFPAGKTTVYTYTKGYADNRLNHNLLTITDAKGQTFVVNEYDPTLNPADINFDRVTRQTWGDPGDLLDMTYVTQVPTPFNNFADSKTILNDRVGNVTEYFYNAGNQVVMSREFTGRANPDVPTTDLLNRPVNPLRPGDPAYFEKRFTWNTEARLVEVIQPNLNSTQYVYDSANPDPRARGNLTQMCSHPGPLGGDQPQICESFEYDAALNGDTNTITRHTDARGHDTIHEYDPAGNQTRVQHRVPSIEVEWEYNAFGQMTAHILPDNGSGHRRRDEYVYHAAPPQKGYLQSRTIDAGGFAMTTGYEYDAVGNVTRQIDPRGNDIIRAVNARNQVVREISREVTPGGGVRYETDFFFDADDNLVRIDTKNIDENGVLQPNTHLSEVREFDIQNFQTRTCREVGSAALLPTDLDCSNLPASEFIETEFAYDANRNRILTRFGEATSGAQPTNTEQIEFDERDLVFRIIRAEGDPLQSTTQVDYDGNGNITITREGMENQPRETAYTYDGYDRLTEVVDAMGNALTAHYDANHNRVAERLDGELVDAPGSAANVRLFEQATVFDDMDRPIEEQVQFFDSATQAPIGSGVAVTQIAYSDNSQVTSVVDDNLHNLVAAYDTANRRSSLTDHKLNTMSIAYDQNSNVVAVTEVDKSDLGNPDGTFVTSLDYDGLDRLIQTLDNAGNATVFNHDSRDNLTLTVDAIGRQTRQVYDGLDRLIQTVRDMNGNGANPADLDDIVTSQSWDRSSRLTARIDDNGHATTYIYDALDRLISEDFADCTAHTFMHDVHDNVVTTVDANGSIVGIVYDLLNRPVGKIISLGPGVSSATTFEDRLFDGRSRLVSAEDDDSLVTRSYDSLSNVTAETLNGLVTTALFDGVGNELARTYPGGRSVFSTFDALDRIATISDGVGLIAAYDYVGTDRVERRDLGNGTRTAFAYDGILPNPPGDFGVRRIVGTTHSVIATGNVIDARTYTWDRVGNKVQRRDVRASGPKLKHDYTYDAVDRLVHTTVTRPPAIAVRNTDYDLDGAGNRIAVAGLPNPGGYVLDAAMCAPADSQMNQYSSTPMDTRLYDDNGNLTVIDDGLPTQRNISYDFRNQMVEFTDASSGQQHTYAYDALGRRIAKVVDSGGAAGGPIETRFFYDGWHVIEEQDGAGITQATYVHGGKVDEVLNMQRGGNDFFYHADDLGSIMAVTDATGQVVERYEYGDYGQPQVLDCAADLNGDGIVGAADLAILLGSWGPCPGCPADLNGSGAVNAADLAILLGSWGPCPLSSTSAIDNPYMFTGRRFDPETGLYYFRTRYLDPIAGRFTTRDVIGLWGDEVNLGNGYTYVGNNPASRIDPFGLETAEGSPVDDALQKYKEALEDKSKRQAWNDAMRELTDAQRKEFHEKKKKIELEKKTKDILDNKDELDPRKQEVRKAMDDLKDKLQKLKDDLDEKIKKENERHADRMKQLKKALENTKDRKKAKDNAIADENAEHEKKVNELKSKHDEDAAKAVKEADKEVEKAKKKKWKWVSAGGSGKHEQGHWEEDKSAVKGDGG